MGFPDFNDDGYVSAPEAMVSLGFIEDGDAGSTDELGGSAGGSGGGTGGCGCLVAMAVAFLLFWIASVIASCMA